MSAKSRTKGSRYMLHVCRVLSRWWCGMPYETPAGDLPFRTRSTSILPVEGHWKGEGDILWKPSLSPDFPFSLECKNQEKGEVDKILEAPCWPVWEWWSQCCRQAELAGATPLLLFTRNRRRDYALLTRDAAHRLGGPPAVSAPVLDVVRPGGEELTLCLLDDLVRVPPEIVADNLR